MEREALDWKPVGKSGTAHEALLGDFEAGDGVRFVRQFLPTCYRRGPFKLIVEVAGGPGHTLWGCLDDADQPVRYYHKEKNLLDEAEAMADVLWADRRKKDGKKVPDLPTDEVLQDLLGLVLFPEPPPLEVIRTWSDNQKLEAEEWAAKTHLHASDHDDVTVPSRPVFLAPWAA